jgi:ornithine cyclodeaminase/alanine dehydrogenase-like protein (mu-crystallin family)
MALATVLHPREVRVHARNAANAQKFIAEMKAHIAAPWSFHESAETAVVGRGVVVTATKLYKPPRPIVRAAWLGDGVLALPIDVSGAFEPATYAKLDKFVCDKWLPLVDMRATVDFLPACPRCTPSCMKSLPVRSRAARARTNVSWR